MRPRLSHRHPTSAATSAEVGAAAIEGFTIGFQIGGNELTDRLSFTLGLIRHLGIFHRCRLAAVAELAGTIGVFARL